MHWFISIIAFCIVVWLAKEFINNLVYRPLKKRSDQLDATLAEILRVIRRSHDYNINQIGYLKQKINDIQKSLPKAKDERFL